MKTTLGIEFEPFFPQISHRAKIGCAKYDLSTGEGVAMEQWYLNMGEVPGSLKEVRILFIYKIMILKEQEAAIGYC